MDPLGKLTKKADATAENAAALVAKAIRGIRAELALLAEELNIAGSAKDRDKAYAMIQSKMAELSKRLDRLMRSQNELAGKTAAKTASEMTGIEVKFSAKRAEAITQLVTPAQGENLAAVFTQNMAQRSINALQEATVAVMREQAVKGGTLKEMGKALGKKWTDALKAPPVFTDSGGNTWDTQTYLQMNIRTNTMRVYNDCLVDDIARSTGEDFVRVSRGGDPMCKLCAPWEGVILSISGKAKGFPSYEQARAAGCFHPNCVHTLEYTDEVADEEEFEIQRKFPATEKEATDPDAMDERRYKIDQERYRRKGLTKDEARIAVDRDNLTDNIRHGLVRGDARDVVDKLTDAQVTALCKDGNPPRFTPTKKATKKDPHAADEKFIRGKRGGVVHIKRDASVEDLIRVARLEDVKEPVKKPVKKPAPPAPKPAPAPEPPKEPETKAEPASPFKVDVPEFSTAKEGIDYIEKTLNIPCKGFEKMSVEFVQNMAKAIADVKAHIGDSSRLRGVWTFAEHYKQAYDLYREKNANLIASIYRTTPDDPRMQALIDKRTKSQLRADHVTKSSQSYGCAHYYHNPKYESLNGIVLNNRLDKKDRAKEVESGFKAKGCEKPYATVYHELGHIIDYHLGIVTGSNRSSAINNAKIASVWANNDVARELSEYGATKPREMIAEAWAEYKMNPNPRPLALTIGRELDKLCSEGNNTSP